jgi:hypothetical protein
VAELTSGRKPCYTTISHSTLVGSPRRMAGDLWSAPLAEGDAPSGSTGDRGRLIPFTPPVRTLAMSTVPRRVDGLGLLPGIRHRTPGPARPGMGVRMAGRGKKRRSQWRKASLSALGVSLGLVAVSAASSATSSYDPSDEAGGPGRRVSTQDLDSNIMRGQPAAGWQREYSSIGPVVEPRSPVHWEGANDGVKQAAPSSAKTALVAHRLVSGLLGVQTDLIVDAAMAGQQSPGPFETGLYGSSSVELIGASYYLPAGGHGEPYLGSTLSVLHGPSALDVPPAPLPDAHGEVEHPTAQELLRPTTSGFSALEVAATSAVTMLFSKVTDALIGKAADEGVDALWKLIRQRFGHDKQVMADLEEIARLAVQPRRDHPAGVLGLVTVGSVVRLSARRAAIFDRLMEVIERVATADPAFAAQLQEIVERVTRHRVVQHAPRSQPSGA